jgi:hypothetical protein
MAVDFLAGQPHFLDHLYPTWCALPEEQRGALCLGQYRMGNASPGEVADHAQRLGMGGWRVFNSSVELMGFLKQRRGPVVTAAFGDLAVANATGRPQVFSEHGAGQSFSNRHPSYSGGERGREHVKLFLCPNETVARRNREFYPGIPNAVVGCPKLDQWHLAPEKPRDSPPVIALSFHWDCRVAPEARTTLPHYQDCLKGLAWQFRLLGHGHPRIQPQLKPIYAAAGIEFVPDFEEVLQRADLYVCDQMSTLYEFASLGRPVVVLNAPWYRRSVQHGLRFWEAATVGVQCDQPADLPAAIEQALEDSPAQQEARRAAVELAYAYCDGHAAERAAAAILEVDPGPEPIRPRRRSMRSRD